MTIRRAENGTVHLEGACPVEDAEPLLQLLLATPKSPVEWSNCQKLHTAVVQVLIAAGAVPAARCGDGWIANWL